METEGVEIMRGYRPSRVTIIVVCCAVASLVVLSFLLLAVSQPGAENPKKTRVGAATSGSAFTPNSTTSEASTITTTASAPTTTAISTRTSFPTTTAIPTATAVHSPTVTPTSTTTSDPDPTSFTISVKGGGELGFNGTVGQQGTQPPQYSINVYYPDLSLPLKSPPPGPLTWSVSATSQDNPPISNWLTLSPSSNTIYYGQTQSIKVTASILPNMQANVTYAMKIVVTLNKPVSPNNNYGIITLTLSNPTPTPDPDPTSFTISVQGATYCYTGISGQSGIQADPNNPPLPFNIYYGGSANPPPGPLDWSVSALALAGASCSDPSPCTILNGSWLSISPASGTLLYNGPGATIDLQASGATNLQTGVYCTKIQFNPVNADKNYAYAELIVSPAPTPTPTATPAPTPTPTTTVQMIAFLPLTSSFFFIEGLVLLRKERKACGRPRKSKMPR